METTKKWWAISVATLYVAGYPEDSFHYEDYHLIFTDLNFDCQIPICMLLGSFYQFSCEDAFQEKSREEYECDSREFFIRMNKNAKISLNETRKGTEIEIEKSRNFTTKLTLNCLNDNGTFNLEYAKEMASIISIDILNILN